MTKMEHSGVHYQGILENLNLGIVEVDLDDRILYVNDMFCKMVGYTEKELLGQIARDLFLPEGDTVTIERFDKNWQERKNGAYSAYNLNIRKKDNSRIWVMVSGGPLHNEEGQVIGSIGIHHDFTDQKVGQDTLARANKELLKRQEFLGAINRFSNLISDKQTIQEIGDVITSNIIEHFDFEDCVVYILDQDRKLLVQHSAYGPKGNVDGKVQNPIEIPLGIGIVGSVGLKGHPEIVVDAKSDPRYLVDDEARNSEMAVPIKYDGKVLGVIDSEHHERDFYTREHLETLTTIANLAAGRIRTALTLEENRRAELKLKESELRLRSIINSSLDAVIMINGQGIVKKWNQKAVDIFGYTQEEALESKLSDLIIPDEYRMAHEKGMAHYHKTGEGPVLNKRIEIKGKRKNGEEFPIEMSIAPIELKNEHYFSAYLRDITKEKETKLQMENALQKQKELNKMKSHFVSMTSHELRTPLTTIKGNTELIDYQLENTEIPNKDKIKKNLMRIEQNVDRLNTLVNNILFLGQLESNRIPFHPEVVVPHAFIDKNILPDYHSRTFKITHQMVGEQKELRLDINLFNQIVINIIDNAIKYSPGAPIPEVYSTYTNEQYELEVRDFGIGIPEEDQKKLFTTFFRASNVGNAQGTGLGLTIVSEFVKLHGGEIKVLSKVGKGTSFKLNFPITSK